MKKALLYEYNPGHTATVQAAATAIINYTPDAISMMK